VPAPATDGADGPAGTPQEQTGTGGTDGGGEVGGTDEPVGAG
jgi:hypothetical protein